MGQVWQATDTQLNRQVALKILPDAFAADPDRLARFTREAAHEAEGMTAMTTDNTDPAQRFVFEAKPHGGGDFFIGSEQR